MIGDRVASGRIEREAQQVEVLGLLVSEPAVGALVIEQPVPGERHAEIARADMFDWLELLALSRFGLLESNW